MKALVLSQYHQLDYREVPLPTVGPEDVLIEIKACGICGSDVHGMDGSTGRRRPPLIMGHEATGVIAQLGARVTGWQVGDRVTFDSTISCGACGYCQRGQTNLCNQRRVLGVACAEFRQDGAFAEYVAVPQRILYRLPDSLSFERAAMVEPVAVAVHAVGRLPIRLNDTALVLGAGMIGLFVVQTLRLAGCGRIVAVDLDRRKLELACQMGADAGLSPADCDVTAEVFRQTGNRGADVVVEVVGLQTTMDLAVNSLRKGGSLCLVGNLVSDVTIPLQAIVSRELTLTGSNASSGDYPASLDLIARGAIDVDPMLSAVAPLAEGAAWFRRLHDGKEGLMKVVLTP